MDKRHGIFSRWEPSCRHRLVSLYLFVESPSAAIRIVSAASTSSTILQAPDSLPLLSLLWVDPSLIIAAGFSGRQCCYSKDSNGSWFVVIANGAGL